MSFLLPTYLLLFIPLGGAIILLYLLKLKRKERIVSSVMLWQDAVSDIQADSPFQKLRKSLLLLLQLLIVLALVTAAARPYVKTEGASENRIVIVLDSSASMQSTCVSGSRFDEAKSIALDTIRRMGTGDAMLIIAAGAKARVATSFTSDKKALAQVVSDLKPVDTSCDMRQAMILALSLSAGDYENSPRITILSDGCFEDLTDLSVSDALIDFVRIGNRCDNVAITGMSSRRTLSGEQQVFIGMQNFSDRTRNFNLEIYVNDHLLDIREQSLAAGETKQEIMSNTQGLGGRILAKLDISDDLEVDNIGWAYLDDPRQATVLLITKGNVFLQNALNLDPRIELFRTDAVPPDLKDAGYDLVVFDGIVPPDVLPEGGYLLINTASSQGPASLSEIVQRPTIINSDVIHPVSDYVDFAGLAIAEAGHLDLKPWATPIVECESGVLGVAGVREGRRFVQLSFDLLESDFPLRVGFPIFIMNCLNWLTASDGQRSGKSIRTGQPVYIDVPPETREITITDPDGEEHALTVEHTPLVYGSTEKAGIYVVEGDGFEWEFACNLASSSESNTAPRDVLILGNQELHAHTRSIRTNKEFYAVLVLVALALLTLEWYAYHRRL